MSRSVYLDRRLYVSLIMHLHQVLVLRTLPSQVTPRVSSTTGAGTDAWRLIQHRDGRRWTLRGQRYSAEFASAERLWSALGGTVAWSHWTPESRKAIESLGGRRWFAD